MIVQKRGDVSIYNLTAGPSLPEWASERARRNLSKKDEGIRRRIELLQDFGMPASSNKIRESPDGRYLLAVGTYPPRVRCYDTAEVGMKFERYVTSGIVDLCLLGSDYGKFCLLQDDRTLAFHAPYGAHESIRIPTFGRALAYESTTCELLVAAKGEAVFRVSLEEGRFRSPWELKATDGSSSSSSASSSCIAVHPVHPLATVGCDDGVVRFWDSRHSDRLQPFVKLDVARALASSGVDSYAAVPSNEITAVAHDGASLTGMHLAVGTATGLVALYDVRSTKPLRAWAHKAGLSIHTLCFHAGHGDRLLLSADEKLIQATPLLGAAAETDSAAANSEGVVAKFHIEATSRFHHFCVASSGSSGGGGSSSSSGVILCATDQPKMEAFYVPSIGVAPRWCSFLENITEELHERDLSRGTGDAADGGGGSSDPLARHEAVYDSYRFLSRDDVESLGIGHLVGTPLLRGYMHGFFIDSNLHRRLAALANPFEYETYQKKKVRERVEAKRASRIAPRSASAGKTAASVNAELAERLLAKAETGASGGGKKAAEAILKDDRFGGLFTNRDFEIDMEDENFKLRNPSGVAAARRRRDNLDSDEEEEDEEAVRGDGRRANVEEESDRADEDGESDSAADPEDDDSDDDSDDVGFKGVKVRGEEYEAMKALRRSPKTKRGETSFASASKKKRRPIAVLEAQGGERSSAAVGLGLGRREASREVIHRLRELHTPIGKRMAAQQEHQQQQHQQQEQGQRGRHSGPAADPLASLRSVQVSVQERGAVGGHRGGKEASYVPRDSASRNQRGEDRTGKRPRRGVKELGLKRLR
jgi:ribosome biogenesis protein ENP2